MAVEIIAEIAQGYEGNPKLAKLLALAALRAGADSVKYQLVIADELCIKGYPYYELFKSLEMPYEVWEDLVRTVLAQQKNFYADVYGLQSLQLAQELGACGVKISTTDFYNEFLIEQAIAKFPKVFISIGGIELVEIDQLVKRVEGSRSVVFMYGFQSEPTRIESNHLLRLRELQKRYPAVSFGFMDHSAGDSLDAMSLPILALGFDIVALEKHITLDPILQIEDYLSALEPARFCQCVEAVRSMEKALGSPDLVLTAQEIEYRNRAGKVVVANKELACGSVIQPEDITLKRISTDGSPDCFRKSSQVVGKILKRSLAADFPVTKDAI